MELKVKARNKRRKINIETEPDLPESLGHEYVKIKQKSAGNKMHVLCILCTVLTLCSVYIKNTYMVYNMFINTDYGCLICVIY